MNAYQCSGSYTPFNLIIGKSILPAIHTTDHKTTTLSSSKNSQMFEQSNPIHSRVDVCMYE